MNATWDDQLVREIAAVANSFKIRRNQVLFVEGMQAQTLYVVYSGRIKVYRSYADGREQILHLLGPNELVALAPFFDGGPYPASAVAIEDSKLGLLSWDMMERLIQTRPDILLLFNRHFARRLRAIQEQLLTMAHSDSTVRVACLLLSLCEAFGTVAGSKVVINLDLTRRDLGACIGLSRETIARTLSELRRSGIISLDGRALIVHDYSHLEFLADNA